MKSLEQTDVFRHLHRQTKQVIKSKVDLIQKHLRKTRQYTTCVVEGTSQ